MVSLPGLFLALVARTAATLGVYAILVLALDGRARQWAHQGVNKLRGL
jgi:hypothetical protein